MATIKSVTLDPANDHPWSGGKRKRRYTIVLTDNNAVDHSTFTMPVKQLPAEDGVAIANQLLESEKQGELNSGDIPTQWNDTQADFDRRALGRNMMISDIDEFHATQSFFQAVAVRGGNNANARAAYLGVVTTSDSSPIQ